MSAISCSHNLSVVSRSAYSGLLPAAVAGMRVKYAHAALLLFLHGKMLWLVWHVLFLFRACRLPRRSSHLHLGSVTDAGGARRLVPLNINRVRAGGRPAEIGHLASVTRFAQPEILNGVKTDGAVHGSSVKNGHRRISILRSGIDDRPGVGVFRFLRSMRWLEGCRRDE